ncbi:6836_t:CDS:1 [Ambispora gerdemannii]|uniref:6836_t:CDS:1 n=1 Tax=Ambispora gerdemannii TaxID=144530 RepID=A0A9N9E2B4_9GLOM|nr:6836_t:CDS:1 [Ambispora gerdemannii]
MKTNFLFVFALLAMICIVNAIPHQLHKRTTTFGPCPVLLPLVELSVTISPDPLVSGKTATFFVKGELTSPATKDFLIYVQIAGMDPPFYSKIPLGTTVNVVLEVPVPANLPADYGIQVDIVDTKTATPVACAFAVVSATTMSFKQ